MSCRKLKNIRKNREIRVPTFVNGQVRLGLSEFLQNPLSGLSISLTSLVKNTWRAVIAGNLSQSCVWEFLCKLMKIIRWHGGMVKRKGKWYLLPEYKLIFTATVLFLSTAIGFANNPNSDEHETKRTFAGPKIIAQYYYDNRDFNTLSIVVSTDRLPLALVS